MLVELESLSLSRQVPFVLRPVAGPIVKRIARESVTRTLDALRRHFERREPLTARTPRLARPDATH